MRGSRPKWIAPVRSLPTAATRPTAWSPGRHRIRVDLTDRTSTASVALRWWTTAANTAVPTSVLHPRYDLPISTTTYDAAGRTESATQVIGTTASITGYGYDAFGRRASVSLDGPVMATAGYDPMAPWSRPPTRTPPALSVGLEAMKPPPGHGVWSRSAPTSPPTHRPSPNSGRVLSDTGDSATTAYAYEKSLVRLDRRDR